MDHFNYDADGQLQAEQLPLQQLADPQLYRFAGTREWQGQLYSLHEFNIHDPPLWGATARMVHDLLRRMELIPHNPDAAL